MNTQSMPQTGRTSGAQPQYSPRGPVPQGNPQAQNAAAPLWNPPQAARPPMQERMSQPRPMPLHRDSPEPGGMVVPRDPGFQPQPKPQRSVEERHQAYKLAQEALHDRHYEDNNIRTAAEIALANFFLG